MGNQKTISDSPKLTLAEMRKRAESVPPSVLDELVEANRLFVIEQESQASKDTTPSPKN